ncbi:MAG: protein kinase [Candidatus Margulisiibacteriota bacterium]
MERFLKSRYKIGVQISDNPYRITYKGTYLSNEKPVIIKIYKRATLNSSLIKIIRQKIKDFSLIHHHNITKIIDGDYGWQGYYYVREYIEGQSLSEILKTHHPLDLDKAIEIMLDVCAALSIAHKNGILHGALCPNNILISTQKIVKVADFVVEKSIKEALPQKAVYVTEDATYLSPEEIAGADCAPSSDIYGAGLVLYAMLAGRLPFDLPKEKISLQVALQKIQSTPLPPSTFNPSIPKNIDDLVLKALERDPLLRFASIDDLAASLKNKGIVTKTNLPDIPEICLDTSDRPQPREKEPGREHIRLPEKNQPQDFTARLRGWFFKILLLTILAGLILAAIMTLIKP